MAAIFQTVLMRLALYGLAASLTLMLLRSRIARDTFAQLLSVWRSLTAFGRVAVCSFLLIGILIGGDKTNSVPPNMNSPQMMQGVISQTGLLFHVPHSPFPIANPVQNSFAEWKAANWNIRGAWKDSFWLAFDEGWVFPWGTNHLSGIEVVSYGQVWPTPFDTNAVASAGLPFEIVRGLTTFAYEYTSSNSYRFVWNDAAINRDTYNLVSAALELFRNGDRSVTTNGVVEYLPRTLPFQHDGFGQDEEWVAANFTNAAEIAAAGGYAAWVDAQVGEGLTNGLYKLSVTVADDPPETTFISVGDLSVAVTNAGDYVFLLEKGPEYLLSFFPPSTNIVVSAVDDVPLVRSAPLLRSAYAWGDPEDGVWQPDIGEFACYYAAGDESATCWWLPALCGFPDVTHLGPSDPSAEFTGLLFDCAHPENASFEWTASEGLVASTPQSQTTLVTATDIPSWRRVWMSVSACFGPHASLSSTLNSTVGTNSTPQAGVTLYVPRSMFENDDDDNNDGTNDCEHVCFSLPENDIARGSIVFSSDDFTNGTIRVNVSNFPGDVYTNEEAAAIAPDEFDVSVYREENLSIDLYFNPWSWTSYQYPSVTAVWIPECGDPQTSSVPFTVVQPIAEPICSETVEHSVLGTNHVYTVNPCGVAVGDDAYFRIKVVPASFPDSEIVWTNNDGRVEFVGGNTGRNVHVRGVSPGDATLEVIIGGRTRQTPTFPLKVVTPQVFKITAWIVTGKNDTFPRSVIDVQNMIAPLNDIYRQVGVSFYLDSVIVTNIPAAYNLVYDEDPNVGWDFERLVNIGHGTGGIECYFVNDFIMSNGEDPPLAANASKGLVMSASAGALTLAHEIGHAFGLSDIYVAAYEGQSGNSAPSTLSVATNFICYACAPFDWNGGCHGRGEGGSRYYQNSARMATIVPRLLMYGVHCGNDIRRDITIGPVDAVNYIGSGDSTVWYDEFAPIGFFENGEKKSSPNHE